LGDISKFSGYFDTLHIVKANGVSPANLNVGNITMDGYSRMNWNTPADNDWEDIGSIRFNNTSNRLTMELKGTVHDFNIDNDHTKYPIIDIMYIHPDPNNPTAGTWDTTHEFHMNGDTKIWGNLLYHGWLVPFDFMDDFAALRAIKTKVDKKDAIYDPDSLKFLQDDKGFFSLGACVGWKLSIQQKFLQEIDRMKLQIDDLQSQLNASKATNQKGTLD
jgi:hypothetical protein